MLFSRLSDHLASSLAPLLSQGEPAPSGLHSWWPCLSPWALQSRLDTATRSYLSCLTTLEWFPPTLTEDYGTPSRGHPGPPWSAPARLARSLFTLSSSERTHPAARRPQVEAFRIHWNLEPSAFSPPKFIQPMSDPRAVPGVEEDAERRDGAERQCLPRSSFPAGGRGVRSLT